jgi:hypothetical protein
MNGRLDGVGSVSVDGRQSRWPWPAAGVMQCLLDLASLVMDNRDVGDGRLAPRPSREPGLILLPGVVMPVREGRPWLADWRGWRAGPAGQVHRCKPVLNAITFGDRFSCAEIC